MIRDGVDRRELRWGWSGGWSGRAGAIENYISRPFQDKSSTTLCCVRSNIFSVVSTLDQDCLMNLRQNGQKW